jgi:hypothetical protein
MCSRSVREEADLSCHEQGGSEMNLWTATYGEAAIVGLCLLTLVTALSTKVSSRESAQR